MGKAKKRKEPMKRAVRRVMREHKLRPDFDSLERLCRLLPLANADELRIALYKRDDCNGSMFIGPGLEALGYAGIL